MTSKETQPISIPIAVSGKATSNCTPPGYQLLPLNHRDVTNAEVNCFYGASGFLSFVNQVHYSYNPGSNANTVSSDLASFQAQAPIGIQLALVGNANTSSCSGGSSVGTGGSGGSSGGSGGSSGGSGGSSGGSIRSPAGPKAASGTGTGSTGGATNTSCGTSSSGSTTPSLSEDIQAITKGGDFALRATWPILNWRPGPAQFMAEATPRAGFSINGLAGQSNATNATNVNWFIPFEAYAELNMAPANGGDSPASVYVDYRGGWEHVSNQFATSAGLTSGNSFGLQQISLGFAINGGIQISAQRYFGPEQAYINSGGTTVSVNNFSNWQVSVQMSPSNTSKK
jgi:hypothetical protein